MLEKYHKTKLSLTTVKQRLRQYGLISRVAEKKPFISVKKRKKRSQFAKQHIDWTIKDWSRVFWSDESNFVDLVQKERYILGGRLVKN